MEAKISGIECRICQKTFASEKGVHGHMKSHSKSERQAAKRDPGQGSAVAAPLPEDGRSAMERTDLLPRFARTGKRWSFKRRTRVLAGPGATEVAETSTPQPPLMEERQRTDLLPRFARTGKRWSFKRRTFVPAGPVAPEVGEMSSSQSSLMEEVQNMELASVDADGPIQDQNDFVCSICTRAFPSYLALGGHKAHHSMRKKKRLAAMGEQEDADYTAADEQARAVYVQIPCLRCGRIFSSRQALGAHKRHCQGPPPPAVENRNKVVRDFDLNELPPPEERGGRRSVVSAEMELGSLLVLVLQSV